MYFYAVNIKKLPHIVHDVGDTNQPSSVGCPLYSISFLGWGGWGYLLLRRFFYRDLLSSERAKRARSAIFFGMYSFTVYNTNQLSLVGCPLCRNPSSFRRQIFSNEKISCKVEILSYEIFYKSFLKYWHDTDTSLVSILFVFFTVSYGDRMLAIHSSDTQLFSKSWTNVSHCLVNTISWIKNQLSNFLINFLIVAIVVVGKNINSNCQKSLLSFDNDTIHKLYEYNTIKNTVKQKRTTKDTNYRRR